MAETLDILALVLKEEGKLTNAEVMARESLAMNQRLYGKDHHAAGKALSRLGEVLIDEGRSAQAEPLLRDAVEIQRNARGDNFPMTYTLHFLGLAYERQGNWAKAEDCYNEVVVIRKRLSAPEHGYLLLRLASVLRRQGRLPEVETALRKAITAFQKPADAGSAYDQAPLAWLLATYPDPSMRDGHRAVAYAEKAVATTGGANAECLDALAAACAETGDFARAINVQKEAITMARTEKEKVDYASRLKLYESGLPYREQE